MIIIMLLIMILTMSTGVYVYDSAVENVNTEILEATEIATFNDPISQYEGKQLGSSVKSLLSYVISNASVNKDLEERLPDVTYVDNGSGPQFTLNASSEYSTSMGGRFTIVSDSFDTQIEAISQLRTNISNTHYYEVEIRYDDGTGLVNEIIINY